MYAIIIPAPVEYRTMPRNWKLPSHFIRLFDWTESIYFLHRNSDSNEPPPLNCTLRSDDERPVCVHALIVSIAALYPIAINSPPTYTLHVFCNHE